MCTENMNEIRVLSPTAILGYGFPEESFIEGMRRKPHVIAVDAGSTDPGPYYLVLVILSQTAMRLSVTLLS